MPAVAVTNRVGPARVLSPESAGVQSEAEAIFVNRTVPVCNRCGDG